MDEEEGETIFTFTWAKLVCPRECRVLEIWTRKQPEDSYLTWAYLFYSSRWISSETPTCVLFKINRDSFTSICKLVLNKSEMIALKMVKSCKSQRKSLRVKLHIFICSSFSSKHPHFSRHLNNFGLQNTSTCFLMLEMSTYL